MDPVTLILTALAADAALRGKDEVSAEVRRASRRLAALVQKRFAGRPAAEWVLARYEEAPDEWEGPLAAELIKVGAGADAGLVAAAQAVMGVAEIFGSVSVAHELRSLSAKYSVNVRGGQGVQVGDRNTQRNIFRFRVRQDAASVAGSITGADIADIGEVVDKSISQRSRYLRGQCPESVQVGEPFSLLVSVVLAGPANAGLKPFDVPSEGRDVLLVIHGSGLRLLGGQRMTIHVPANRDSEPVMFELRADTPGSRPVSITAWLGGSYLGELLVEVTAERDHPAGTNRNVFAEITTEPTRGAVSLVVRYDPRQNTYRFEFRDEDNPEEVTSNLAYEPGSRVEQLVAELDELAKDRTGYSAAQARDYLINAGAGLWRELIPERLRQQFWDRQHRIRQLTILADKDAVPWELLYPMDPGHDAGFLVEQFPVTRAIFGRAPSRRLTLRPARFVLPEGSPPEARAEIEAMRRLLDPEQPPEAVIAALTPLQGLIGGGDFGLLHFACHNRFDPADGSSITLDQQRQFTPTLMTTSAINRALARSAPTVFINACRTAGLTATYNRLDGWASKFLEAGAAVFIGSLWAVSDLAGREFAGELYSHLQRGQSLGKALLSARQAAAAMPGDPTWLAYTVYGDPGATISRADHAMAPVEEQP